MLPLATELTSAGLEWTVVMISERGYVLTTSPFVAAGPGR